MNDLKLTTEQELLIGLCRLDLSQEQTGHLKTLSKNLDDWPGFARVANDHGISALVYYNLEKHALWQFVNDDVRVLLYNSYLKSLSRNANLLEKFTVVSRILRESETRPLLIKGMALELTIYGNIGLRQMNDIDFHLEREVSLNAWNSLISLGYTPNRLKSPLYRSILLYIGKHLPDLVKDGVSFEIHHSLFDEAIDPAAAGQANSEFLIPDPQQHFLYLIKHLNYHENNGESQLRLYTDLFLMIEKYGEEILNRDLVELAEKAGIIDVLSDKLIILKTFWGLKIPSVLVEIDGTINDHLFERFRNFLVKPKGNPVRQGSVRYRETVKNIPGWHRKFIYVLGDLFPSLTFMKKRYGTKTRICAVVYYPHRLGKVLLLFKRFRAVNSRK
ncbi:MAG: nucleotidyltransferase family protein [Bacteroidales bacterium]|nr:nucleotidyltransferase family protein [Bacteroidales bacterium]